MRTGAGKMIKQFLAVMLVGMMSLSSPVIAQTTIPDPSRPISGVIAATKAPVTISYINEDGEQVGRVVGVGAPIYLNDEISTDGQSSLQVLLRDQTVFSIGPNSTLVFDEFVFDPTKIDDVALTASVTKGTFKFISGKVSKLKPGAMTLKLPNATASIRGTSVVGRVSETGASDLVLLSGAVQLQTTTAAPIDLVQPGWGVSVADTGAASEPEPFSAAEIDEFIQEVEVDEEEATLAEADAAAPEEDGEGEAPAETAATDEADAPTEAVEEVNPIEVAIREAGASGEDITEEEITAIIAEAGGDQEAVAEALVKVIIDEQIASGELTTEDLESFEAGDLAALAGEEFALEFEEIEGLEGGDIFVDAISTQLTQVLDERSALAETPSLAFDDGLSNFAFEEVKLTETFKIEDISNLIVSRAAPDVDTENVKLSFFDILYNAEEINAEFKDEPIFTSFQDTEAKDDEGTANTVSFSFERSALVTRGAAEIDEQKVDETKADTPSTDTPSTDAPAVEVKEVVEAPTLIVPTLQLEVKEEPVAETVLTELVTVRTPAATITPVEVEIEEQAKEEDSSRLLALIKEVEQRTAEDTIDPLDYYQAGKTEAIWATVQAGPVLGNTDTMDGLISESYGGSAKFSDSFTISNSDTAFKARAGYNAVVNYDSFAVTGSVYLSSVSLGSTNYVTSSNSGTAFATINTDLSAGALKKPITDNEGHPTGAGNDENGNGYLDVGESLEDVRIGSVAIYDRADTANADSYLAGHLSMSVGSVIAGSSVMDGTLGEFTMSVEEYAQDSSCAPSCTELTKQRIVGTGTSVVRAQ